LGIFGSNDGGYLKGGSLLMAQKMVKRFESYKGKIEYNARVEQVLVENGKAAGVLVNGEKISADSVIVTTDTMVAIDTLFEKPLQEKWTDAMRSLTNRLTISTYVSLGIEADLSGVPEYQAYLLDKPFMCGTEEHNVLRFEHYAAFKDYAPPGCTAGTMIISGNNYDFWKKAKENGTYNEEKEKLAQTVINILYEKLPQIKGKIAVTDVATPLTYERYCSSCQGSWMTTLGRGEKRHTFPLKSQTVKSLYFAGHRITLPGGMPLAAFTGRQAAQYLCKDEKAVFQGEM
jgi:phytoene dehydrogenase-like protein